MNQPQNDDTKTDKHFGFVDLKITPTRDGADHIAKYLEKQHGFATDTPISFNQLSDGEFLVTYERGVIVPAQEARKIIDLILRREDVSADSGRSSDAGM